MSIFSCAEKVTDCSVAEFESRGLKLLPSERRRIAVLMLSIAAVAKARQIAVTVPKNNEVKR